MDQFSFCIKNGNAIAEILDDLASLRIQVFRAFPYLYEGTLDYEKKYLQTYIACPQSFLFGVYVGEKLVGATTCIPLQFETQEVKQPFEDAGICQNNILYYGESILLEQYRGNRLGKRFFIERENYARTLQGITTVCFCAVVRPETHPLKPKNYLPLDNFWKGLDYNKDDRMSSYFEWQDIDETTPSKKQMIYWFKKLV